jgi:hypothetical protein
MNVDYVAWHIREAIETYQQLECLPPRVWARSDSQCLIASPVDVEADTSSATVATLLAFMIPAVDGHFVGRADELYVTAAEGFDEVSLAEYAEEDPRIRTAIAVTVCDLAHMTHTVVLIEPYLEDDGLISWRQLDVAQEALTPLLEPFSAVSRMELHEDPEGLSEFAAQSKWMVAACDA